MRLRIVATVTVLAGCMEAPAGVVVPPAPSIEGTAVAANPHNVLSATVSVRVRQADSVAVRFELPGAEDAGTTPPVAVIAESAVIPVLGLLPERGYLLRPVAYGAGGTITGEPLELTTGSLPSDLPSYTAEGEDPSPGYVVFAAGPYGLVIDNTGRVVWYRRFPNGPGLNFMAQPNGRYVARPTTPDPADLDLWVELDPLGDVTRTFGCAHGLQPRLHDLIAEPDGSYWIMCDESRTMDLSARDGVQNARVTGTVIQHVSAAGVPLFHWSPFDHFAITDVELSLRTGAVVNWTHGNAIDLDAAGNLIVSFRNLGEVTKIEVPTGRVLWRLGGLRNQFTFIGTASPPFAQQHSARAYAPGALLILDNFGDPDQSRAERYTIDETTRTARLAGSYGSLPAVVTQIGGSVQDLPGGRTLVSFGTTGRVEEYDASGRVVWRITGNAGYVFRAQRIRSLHAPGVGTSR